MNQTSFTQQAEPLSATLILGLRKLPKSQAAPILACLGLRDSSIQRGYPGPVLEYRIRNAEAARLVQSGAAATPLWDLGLDGAGQVIGIGDTGLAMHTCSFKDPSVPVPYDEVDTRHRKVSGTRSHIPHPKWSAPEDGTTGFFILRGGGILV